MTLIRQQCYRNLFLPLLICLGSFGCALSSTVTASNVDKPVLVGHVKKIKGERGGKLGEPVAMFNIEAEQLSDTLRADYSIRQTEGSNKFDVELLRIAENNPDGQIVIKDLYLGSYNFNYIFAWKTKAWIGMNGFVYKPSPK